MPHHTLETSTERFTVSSESAGFGAVDVRAAGEIDLATAPALEQALLASGQAAPLTVLAMQDVTFMDCSGLHVILTATRRARAASRRLVVAHMPPHVESLFTLTDTYDELDAPAERSALPETAGSAVPRAAAPPPVTPVNATIMRARVMAVPDCQLWLQVDDGDVQRAWAPAPASAAAAPGASVELYVDHLGAVNGWWDATSGLAVNQRHLDRTSPPPSGDPLACQGPCGLVWHAPAADRLAELGERCLTCAGPLAPG